MREEGNEATRQQGMSVAILCPGRSVTQFAPGPGEYDKLIGVNRAAGFKPCDYWVMLDYEVFARSEPIGWPPIVTRGGIYRALVRAFPEGSKHPFINAKSCDGPVSLHWKAFSSTTALMFAAHLGATRIDCFGMDWEGDSDWDGTPHTGRDPERWAREEKLWDDLVRWLANRLIVVMRHVNEETVGKMHVKQTVSRFAEIALDVETPTQS
jgi:hypothetical protein